MSWRQIAGGAVMMIGALVSAVFLTLAGVVIANFVEWDNAVDALSTVALVTAPPFAAGVVFIGLGRWIYGFGQTFKPLRRSAAILLRLCGIAITCIFGAFLIVLVFTGVGPEDRGAVVRLAVLLIAGLSLIFISFTVRPSRDRTH